MDANALLIVSAIASVDNRNLTHTLTRRRQYAVSAILVSAIRFFSDLKIVSAF
jgi:hypothetical protein